MSASWTHACIGTSLAYMSEVQRDCRGVRRSFETRLHRVVFCRAGLKINGAYYHEVLLTQKLLPVIRQISGNEFIFQQDSAPAHCACKKIELFRRETPDFISPEQWPPISPDLNPVDYEIWATMWQRIYQTKIRNVDELQQCLLNVWSSNEQDVRTRHFIEIKRYCTTLSLITFL